MISRYDNIITGFAVSLVVAFVAYALLLQAQEFFSVQLNRTFNFRPRSVALIAICLNIVPMNYFRRRYHNKSLRGLVIGTMVLAAAWFIYFGRDVLNT